MSINKTRAAVAILIIASVGGTALGMGAHYLEARAYKSGWESGYIFGNDVGKSFNDLQAKKPDDKKMGPL